jgi:glutamate synthase (NADPH/NADH) large chain
MHFALLIGYGALAINPYLALDSIDYMVEKKLYIDADYQKILSYLKKIT